MQKCASVIVIKKWTIKIRIGSIQKIEIIQWLMFMFRLRWRSQPTCSWKGCRTRTRLRLAPDLQKHLRDYPMSWNMKWKSWSKWKNGFQVAEINLGCQEHDTEHTYRWLQFFFVTALLRFEKQYFITSRIFGVISLLNVSQNFVFPESLWRLSSVLGQMRRGLAITGNCSWPACSGCLLSLSPPTPSPPSITITTKAITKSASSRSALQQRWGSRAGRGPSTKWSLPTSRDERQHQVGISHF